MVRLYLLRFSRLRGGCKMVYLVLISAFLTIFFGFLGIYTLVFSKRLTVAERLDLYTKDDDMIIEDPVSSKEFLLGIIRSVSNGLSRKTYLEDVRKKLLQAYVFMRPEEFVGMSILVGSGIGLLLYLITKMWLVGIVGLLIGFKIPDIIISSIKKKRMRQLNTQLPDALTIVSNGLRAGFSFTQAMNVAATEMDSPLRDEFLKIIRDNSIGKTLDEALMDFSERTDDDDIDMFVTALIIQRKVGGNLAEILDTIAATIRDRARIRGEVKTLTAQGKISAIVITLLPIGVAIFLFFVNPEYLMELFTNKVGLFMVAGAVFMQILGGFLMLKIADIEI
jgi:tight adherence protein B